jgi:type I restriction enzyme S subunit
MLLERIRRERRHRWEEGLRARGKDPSEFTYEALPAPDVSSLPELPQGWVWTTIGEIGAVSGGLTKNANRENP